VSSRPSLAVATLAVAAVLAVAACSSSSATASPGAQASVAAAPSDAGSSAAAASDMPSFALPSALASALAGGGSAPDAGTIVTADMAASVIGGSPSSVSPPISIPTMSIASYANATGDTVTVFIQNIPGGIANAQLQAAIAMAGAQGELQPVTGLGDSAGKVVNDKDATVAFVKGSNLVVVEATSGTTAGSDLEPKLEAVAQQVASHLP
jgi:hypothetical protein